ncbi:cyclophilin-type peptidylprolyl cis-trans isomerase [Corallococcus coralloides DSM 2259]|uniref:Peptidyl-prolyl cis-trans isomerase n=1 Tax=Corallococcus coralloides (strain ATCC 25202 / DSM 2259 / NBRC 100086 / M2) TaxID=1144275 RepID=H8MP97_CORCM|nr:peptidylprolyl isomerase [Corallococcus coralloides]AFE08492.1 cyclophilin-type peptidylprolyl cis-trans isomerase [Corallococcus coralloides DSM 2259]
MRTRFLTAGLLCLALTACSKDKEQPPAAKAPAAQPSNSAAATRTVSLQTDVASAKGFQKKALEGQDLWATMETNQGTIVLKLFSKDAPKTVANFVGLASGEQEWINPKTGERVEGKPLYDGVIFHRVIPDFMIQGGDPTGTGRGDPGYRFEDEFKSNRDFDKEGLLAMANAGPGTNGSQFFITTSKPNFLKGRHTIFGEVVKGYDDVVLKIANTPRNRQDRPDTEMVIKHITISDTQP